MCVHLFPQFRSHNTIVTHYSYRLQKERDYLISLYLLYGMLITLFSLIYCMDYVYSITITGSSNLTLLHTMASFSPGYEADGLSVHEEFIVRNIWESYSCTTHYCL